MADATTLDVDVDYELGKGESPSDYPQLADKLQRGLEVVETALDEYDNPAVMWTGGKDSTLVLYLVKEVVEEHGYEMPPTIFIDHYQHFDDTMEFVERWADEWNLDVHFARNGDFERLIDEKDLEPGDELAVGELSNRNQYEVREKLQYEDDTFPFLLDTLVGNHLLKTVALNDALEAHDVDGVISGVRWDEQEARSDELFFSERHDSEKYPPHDRVHPILQFEERAVWDATWGHLVPDTVDSFPDNGYVPKDFDDIPEDVTHDDIPVSPKYFRGYRSLGSEVSTEKSAEDPAWLQDLGNTVERAGRAQDKEDLMGRLRDLGYM